MWKRWSFTVTSTWFCLLGWLFVCLWCWGWDQVLHAGQTLYLRAIPLALWPDYKPKQKHSIQTGSFRFLVMARLPNHKYLRDGCPYLCMGSSAAFSTHRNSGFWHPLSRREDGDPSENQGFQDGWLRPALTGDFAPPIPRSPLLNLEAFMCSFIRNPEIQNQQAASWVFRDRFFA
jgi:hypothetical protein